MKKILLLLASFLTIPGACSMSLKPKSFKVDPNVKVNEKTDIQKYFKTSIYDTNIAHDDAFFSSLTNDMVDKKLWKQLNANFKVLEGKFKIDRYYYDTNDFVITDILILPEHSFLKGEIGFRFKVIDYQVYQADNKSFRVKISKYQNLVLNKFQKENLFFSQYSHYMRENGLDYYYDRDNFWMNCEFKNNAFTLQVQNNKIKRVYEEIYLVTYFTSSLSELERYVLDGGIVISEEKINGDYVDWKLGDYFGLDPSDVQFMGSNWNCPPNYWKVQVSAVSNNIFKEWDRLEMMLKIIVS